MQLTEIIQRLDRFVRGQRIEKQTWSVTSVSVTFSDSINSTFTMSFYRDADQQFDRTDLDAAGFDLIVDEHDIPTRVENELRARLYQRLTEDIAEAAYVQKQQLSDK